MFKVQTAVRLGALVCLAETTVGSASGRMRYSSLNSKPTEPSGPNSSDWLLRAGATSKSSPPPERAGSSKGPEPSEQANSELSSTKASAGKSNPKTELFEPAAVRNASKGQPASPPAHSNDSNDSSESTDSTGSNSRSTDSSNSTGSDSTGSKSSNSSNSSIPRSEYQAYLDSNLSSYSNIQKFSDLPQEFGYNQHMSIDQSVRVKLKDTLWKFKAPVRYAFAYGSGVFSQGSSYASGAKPQIDLIFGVSHSEHWHSLNMKQFPEHYSFLRAFGSGAVSVVQDRIGAGVYFNPFVELNGLIIKYGVVNIDTLLNDLKGWNTLYLAGRLHKPVKILRDEPRVRFVNQANLISVLRASLLLLPESFTELDLYKTIAGISYMGDPRMQFGENPHKVTNIVVNQFANFRKLYSPLMDDLPNLRMSSSDSDDVLSGNKDVQVASLAQDMDPIRRGNMVMRLPSEFRTKIYSRYSSKFKDEWKQVADDNDFDGRHTCDKFDQLIASDARFASEVARAIRHTVAWPSFSQSAKGLLTAGLLKSFKYSSEKITKYRHGKQGGK